MAKGEVHEQKQNEVNAQMDDGILLGVLKSEFEKKKVDCCLKVEYKWSDVFYLDQVCVIVRVRSIHISIFSLIRHV